MKVYIVFSCEIDQPVIEKVFLNENKASDYVDKKNEEDHFLSYWCEKVEVEQ